ncbi:MAG: kinase [Paracoccus denitrificans]|nr:MAG: kinase [Paracoccus denitrificans]PZO84182.1 MAG: kinase [Paracoccus denitrificans]
MSWTQHPDDHPRPDVLCIGAVLWDVIGRSPRTMSKGDDVPGRIAHIPGGVALNVAIALARRGRRPAVLGAVGRDGEGEALCSAARSLGVDVAYLTRDAGLPTDVYMAIEDDVGLIAAIADAHSLEKAGDAIVRPLRHGPLGRPGTPWLGPVVIDGNLTVEMLATLATDPALAAADLRVVPASPGKAERLAPLMAHPNATLYLNRAEAETLAGHACVDAATAAAAVIQRGAARVLVTDGGQLAACAARDGEVLTALPPSVRIARVTGAGDCFLAAHLVAEHGGLDRRAALDAAVAAAAAHVSGKDTP